MNKRIERVMAKQGLSRKEAERDIKKVDKWRDNYIKKYANTSRYDTRNYDLVINMADLTEDDAVDIILDYIDKSN
jgi:cytidylate kinase